MCVGGGGGMSVCACIPNFMPLHPAPPPHTQHVAQHAHQLAFLDQWRSRQDVSQALLRQHSQWLRTFREQVRVCEARGGAFARVPRAPRELAGAWKYA